MSQRIGAEQLHAFFKAFNEDMPKFGYVIALARGVQAAALGKPYVHKELEAHLLAELVMGDLYDFAISYNSDSLRNPKLYSLKHDAIRETLAQLAMGGYSLVDNPYTNLRRQLDEAATKANRQ